MRHLLIVSFLFFSISFCFGQSVNDYRYVLVPEQFELKNSRDQYALNVATKQQLKSYGFDAYLNNDSLPFDTTKDICNILNLKVIENSGLFSTKVTLTLENCFGKVIFTSEEGISREKNYQRAYAMSFRKALLSFKALNYSFNGKNDGENALANKGSEDISEENVIDESVVMEDGVVIEYVSLDGFYKLKQEGNSLIFFEESTKIGEAQAVANAKFPVKTSQFNGLGFFNKGDFVLKRSIKGIGEVEMRFVKK